MQLAVEQFRRVKRFLARIEDQDRDSTEYDDDLWAFFQNCWHLKDWLIADPTVPTASKDRVEYEAQGFLSIRICADMANRTKHAELTKRNREDARAVSRDVSVFIGTTSTSAWWIQLRDGSRHEALTLARQAVQDWQELLTRHNITDT